MSHAEGRTRFAPFNEARNSIRKGTNFTSIHIYPPQILTNVNTFLDMSNYYLYETTKST